MSQATSVLNKSSIRLALKRAAGFRKSPARLFAILTLLILTASLSLNASAQASVSQYSQGFETTGDWNGTTVTRVSSGNNGITSKSGSFHGEAGTNFTRWGGYNAVFPSYGYTTSVAVYLNVGGGFANDTRFDWDSAISDAAGGFRRDFVFNVGYYNDAGPYGSGARFVMSASNNTPGNPRNPARSPYTITSSGWYTFKHRFYNAGGGVLAVDLSILNAAGTVLSTWTLSDSTDIIGSNVGGNRYGWFPANAFPFLAIDDSDRSNLGLQTSINVTPAASPTATDNDYTRINNAVQFIASGGAITLNGTFNWTEANAAASWAKGSDNLTGGVYSGDDYSIVPPVNRDNITFTAASLGAAAIQGPGDLAGLNLEGVLQFYSTANRPAGANQNWTISNIRFLDFDSSIFFDSSAAINTAAFSGTKIQNNYIRIPNDLNATVAPADVNQNIGIHFSFGANQLISGNTIETPGDGVSDGGTNFSSVVGMQSNTSGGAYEGLQITNNTINVLNAQSAFPQTTLGIWENGHAHTSNITVSGNQVLSLAGGNNPSVNLLRGFRITSHSSATTTVTYSNNRVEGANIGFQWLAGQAFGGNQPVKLTSNLIRNNATGVLVQSQGLANLKANRIVGNSAAGVQNIDGAADAESNWWGCNYGPGATGPGCAAVTNVTLGVVDAEPWLVLRTNASPNPILTGTNATVTSNLRFNSANVDTSALGTVPNGAPAAFSAVLGTVSPTGGTTASGVTGTTFTAGGTAGNGSASTLVDGQTASAPIVIVTAACNNLSVPAGMTSTTPGSIVVPITTDNLTDRGISSYDFTFTYNPSVLTFTGVDQSGTISSGMTVTPNSGTPGTLIISGFGAAYLTGSGTLLKLNFTVNGAIGAGSALNFSGFTFNEGIPCAATTNGSFTVISGTISGQVTYLNNASITPVSGVVLNGAGAVAVSDTTDAGGLYDLSGLGNSGYTVTPSKTGDVSPGGIDAITGNDASRIAQHVVGVNPFTSGGGAFQSADVTGNGTITSLDASMVARYVVSLPSANTGTWKFVPLSRTYTLAQVQSGMANQDYQAILMGDVTGNWNDSTPTPTRPNIKEEDKISVNAPRMSVESGSELVIPVQLGNLNRKDITSYQFEIAYSPKIIRPTANPCDVLGTVSKDLTVICNSETSGLLKVVVFGTTGLDNDGVLLNLRFAAVGTAGSVSPLTVKQLMLNEGEPQSRSTDGEVTISGVSKDSDSINGRLLTSKGEGVADTEVILTAGSGEVRSVYTDESGDFSFDKVTVGETYVITVNSKGYVFAPQTVSAAKGLTEINIIAEP